MEKTRNAYRIIVRKSPGKQPVELSYYRGLISLWLYKENNKLRD
jgi:hypothetical protein